MRRGGLWVRAVLVCCVEAGCAEIPRAPLRDPASCYACDELARAEDFTSADLPAVPPSREFSSPGRFATVRIGDAAGAETGARPARARKVDIAFRNASFQDAARLLADAGRFAIVIEDAGASEVDAHLRDVEPFEALVLLAQARGLLVEYDRAVVVVSRKSATAPSTPPGSPR